MEIVKNWKKYLTLVNVSTFLVLAIFALIHIHLISNTFYVDPQGSIHSTREGYGDIPLHLTQVTKFAFNPNFDLVEPIYYGTELQYPFFLNLFRGLVLKITGLWNFSFLWPVYFLAVANLVLLFTLYRKFLKSRFSAISAIFLFFLGSGLGAWKYLEPVIFGNHTWSDFLQIIVGRYVSTINVFDSVYPAQNIDFGAPLSLAFIHQQTFFLGFFGFLLFLWLLLKVKDYEGKKYIIGGGLVLGLLPLSHTHSFVAAVIALAVIIILHFGKDQVNYLKKLFSISIIGFVLAAPQMWFLLSAKKLLNTTADFARFRLGWMVEPGLGSVQFAPGHSPSIFSLEYLNFLWMNFGFILPLFILALILILIIKKHQDKFRSDDLVWLVISGALTFLAVQIVKFQPWDTDNNKVLVYFLFFATPAIIWLAEYFIPKKLWLRRILIVVTVFLCTFSGIVDLIPRLLTAKSNLPIIFTSEARDMADYIRNNISANDLILTNTSNLNLVASLSGRPVLEGYPGWLWTRGIDYKDRDSEIRNFYQMPTYDSQILKDYPIKYILFDPEIISAYQIDSSKFDKLFNRVYSIGEYKLYSITPKKH